MQMEEKKAATDPRAMFGSIVEIFQAVIRAPASFYRRMPTSGGYADPLRGCNECCRQHRQARPELAGVFFCQILHAVVDHNNNNPDIDRAFHFCGGGYSLYNLAAYGVAAIL
jgi:hypothetical protein